MSFGEFLKTVGGSYRIENYQLDLVHNPRVVGCEHCLHLRARHVDSEEEKGNRHSDEECFDKE
jgi:hypothetical protein